MNSFWIILFWVLWTFYLCSSLRLFLNIYCSLKFFLILISISSMIFKIYFYGWSNFNLQRTIREKPDWDSLNFLRLWLNSFWPHYTIFNLLIQSLSCSVSKLLWVPGLQEVLGNEEADCSSHCSQLPLKQVSRRCPSHVRLLLRAGTLAFPMRVPCGCEPM